MMRLVLNLFIGYAAFLILLFFLQRRLLYYPDLKKPPQSHLQALGLQPWPAPDGTIKGYIALHSSAHNAGTVVIFHGNAGAAWNRQFYIKSLAPWKYNVVLAEYPGYGGRPGGHGEKLFVTDAKETVLRALQEFGAPLFLLGESLGCGVVAALASDPTIPSKGIALFTPWDTLPDLAQSIYWFLPAYWFVKDKYNNIRNLQNYPNRIAVIMAGKDELIPHRHGMRLYATLPHGKKLWVLEAATHNSWPNHMNENRWKEIITFLREEAK